MNIDTGEEFYPEGVIFLRKTKTRAGMNTGLIEKEIKSIINDQAVIISEGRSLVAAIEDCPKNQQIGLIISWLNKELQDSSERLEELITHFESA